MCPLPTRTASAAGRPPARCRRAPAPVAPPAPTVAPPPGEPCSSRSSSSAAADGSGSAWRYSSVPRLRIALRRRSSDRVSAARAAPAPRAASCSQSVPQRWCSTKRSGSSSSAGGSSSTSAARCSSGRRGRSGRRSMPRTRSCSSAPGGPKRATTAEWSSAASSPIGLAAPARADVPASRASAGSRPSGSGARKAASSRRPPAGMTPAPMRAATAAPKRVLPMPTRGCPGSNGCHHGQCTLHQRRLITPQPSQALDADDRPGRSAGCGRIHLPFHGRRQGAQCIQRGLEGIRQRGRVERQEERLRDQAVGRAQRLSATHAQRTGGRAAVEHRARVPGPSTKDDRLLRTAGHDPAPAATAGAASPGTASAWIDSMARPRGRGHTTTRRGAGRYRRGHRTPGLRRPGSGGGRSRPEPAGGWPATRSPSVR